MINLMRPPEYGSEEWRALPPDDPMRIASVIHAASCWRLLTLSPHIADLVREWSEWCHRADLRDTKNAISVLSAGIADAPTYSEIARRRAVSTRPELSPEEIRTQTDASWAEVEREIALRRCA